MTSGEPRRSTLLSRGPAAICALALMAAVCATALPMRDVPLDDKLIVAVYARNLVEGKGWVFNEGEPVNAATSTLAPLLGAGAGLLGFPIPEALWWISVGALALAAALLALPARGKREVGRDHARPTTHDLRPTTHEQIVRLLPAALIATSSFLAGTHGLETSLFLLGMVLIANAVDAGRWREAFVWGGWMPLVRGEGLLLAALLVPLCAVCARGSSFVGRRSWVVDRWSLHASRFTIHDSRHKIHALWLLVPTVPWALFSWMQFGGPFPNTLEIKRLQGTSGLFDEGGVINVLLRVLWHSRPVWVAALLPLGLLGLLGVRRWLPSTWLFAAFALGTMAAYAAWHIPATSYPWYAAPLLLCVLWVCGEGARALARWGRVPVAAALVAAVALAGDAGWIFRNSVKAADAALYRQAGEWVRLHTAPGDRVAVTEIGRNGWHMRRRLVDIAGLATPDLGLALLRDFDPTRWLTSREPEWILMRPANDRLVNENMLATPGFRFAYRLRERFALEGEEAELLLYERVAPLAAGRASAERAREPLDRNALRIARWRMARANESMEFQALESPPELLQMHNGLTATWRAGEGLWLDVPEDDGQIWLPNMDVAAPIVRAVEIDLALEADTRRRALVVQLHWSGVTPQETPAPLGLLEQLVAVNAGPQRVVFPLGEHPRALAMARIGRLRLDPGPVGTRALLVGARLVSWEAQSQRR